MAIEKELRPIKETTADYDQLELKILSFLKREIYFPILKEIRQPRRVLNSTDDVISALASGRIYFSQGQFKGQFNSVVSRELKKIGAKWDRKQGSWKVPLSSLPVEIKAEIQVSNYRFEKSIQKIDKKIRQISQAFSAESLKLFDIFDASLFKIDRDMKATVKGITVIPKLTDERRKKIAEEYSENLKLYIKDWSDKEILKLREDVQKHAFNGNRYDSLAKIIQKSYGSSEAKAKFLARQETSLLMTKFKEVRYQEAGVNKYKWQCVVGSGKHPVRPMHKKLDGKIFSFDNPPVTDENGNRNNPGQDYNCRCYAIPIVKF